MSAAALARRGDPDTAHEAAAGVTPHLSALEARVLAALAEIQPATAHQLAAHAGLSLVSVSPRMRPLSERGRVRPVGVDRTSGRPRTRWALPEPEQGRAA